VTPVADDEPTAREVILTFLADEPSVEVVGEAGNGDEAVDVVRRLEPDLLFQDVQPPDRLRLGGTAAADLLPTAPSFPLQPSSPSSRLN
jgi:chemotaxis response regulator CheB